MSKFIAISGASHSGKTTFINDIKKDFENIIVVGECIRSEKINIDDIRSNGFNHLMFQKNAILNKICEEISHFGKYESHEDKIILFDRSLVDSYFYLTNYQDKISLTNEQKIEYFKFEKYVRDRMQEHIKNVYNYIFLFEPIIPINLENDKFRTKDLLISQDYEYNMIKSLTYYYAENHSIICHSVANKMYDYFDEIYKNIHHPYQN